MTTDEQYLERQSCLRDIESSLDSASAELARLMDLCEESDEIVRERDRLLDALFAISDSCGGKTVDEIRAYAAAAIAGKAADETEEDEA